MKIHNLIAKIMFVLFWVSIAGLDSEPMWVPVTCLCVSGLYLAVYAYKKGWLFGSIEDGDEE